MKSEKTVRQLAIELVALTIYLHELNDAQVDATNEHGWNLSRANGSHGIRHIVLNGADLEEAKRIAARIETEGTTEW
jgi:hypothetical protein